MKEKLKAQMLERRLEVRKKRVVVRTKPAARMRTMPLARRKRTRPLPVARMRKRMMPLVRTIDSVV